MSSSKTSQVALRNLAMILLGVAVLVLGFLSYKKDPGIASFQVNGEIERVEGDTIYLKGAFFINEKGGDVLDAQGKSVRKDIGVKVSNATELKKTIWYMPTKEQLQATGGAWNPRDLNQEEAKATLEEMKPGLQISAYSDQNIFSKSSFSAKRVTFTEQRYP